MTPVLYLHGFASGPFSSKALHFRQHLESAGFQVTIPDLAEGDFQRLTITRQLSLIERIAQGRPVCLIGSSMGGYLAALYAARHPEVARVVLLAPAFGFARRWSEYLGPEQVERWKSAGTMEVFHYGENAMRPLDYALLDDAGLYEEFPDVRQPVLIFHGDRDDVVPAAYSHEFAAAHPDTRLEILHSGHELLDMLEYMVPEAVKFLAG